MADLTVTKPRPLPGYQVVDLVAGAALNVGDLVYLAIDGTAKPAAAAAADTAAAVGVVVSCKNGTDALAGETVAVQYAGRCAGFSGGVAGDILYTSATAGKIANAAPGLGSNKFIVGRYLADDIILLNIAGEPVVVA